MQVLEADFTNLFLRFLVSDRIMLQAVGSLVDPHDFEDKSERIVAQLAIEHWRESQEPISSYLRIEVGDYIERRRSPMRDESRAALMKLVNSILKRDRPMIAATKVHKKFVQFKTEQFMRRSMDEILEAQLQGQLTIQKFGQIARDCANYTADNEFKSRNYSEELEGRIAQRAALQENRYPLFFIDPLDDVIRSIGRKELGLWLAPWKSGKSMALLWNVYSLALQRRKALHISFEDTQDIVDRRMDALVADLPINQLVEMSTELRDRFEAAMKRFRNRIRFIDAVGKKLTVAQIDGIWERERSNGFISDATVIDYDEKIAPSDDSSRRDERHKINDTYEELQEFASRRDQILWSAAQVGRKGDRKKIIDGGMVAEDIGKIRKAVVAIGIGFGDKGENSKHLYVTHRDGKSRFGVDIQTNYANATFYDRDATLKMYSNQKAELEVEDAA